MKKIYQSKRLEVYEDTANGYPIKVYRCIRSGKIVVNPVDFLKSLGVDRHIAKVALNIDL